MRFVSIVLIALVTVAVGFANGYSAEVRFEDYINPPQFQTTPRYEWHGNPSEFPNPQTAIAGMDTAEPYFRCYHQMKGTYGYVDDQGLFVPVGPMCPRGKKCTCLVGGIPTAN